MRSRRSRDRARPRLPAGPMRRPARSAQREPGAGRGGDGAGDARGRRSSPTAPTRGSRSYPPTSIKAEVPNASKLVEGNDVRAGGFRVGQVTRHPQARARRVNGQVRAIAVLELELDKTRRAAAGGHDGQRSARARRSGLKYVELAPGGPARAIRPATRSRCAPATPRPRTSRTCSRLSSRRRASTPARRSRASATAWPGGGRRSTRTIEALRPVPDAPRARDARAVGQTPSCAGCSRRSGQTLRQAAPVAAVQAAWID